MLLWSHILYIKYNMVHIIFLCVYSSSVLKQLLLQQKFLLPLWCDTIAQIQYQSMVEGCEETIWQDKCLRNTWKFLRVVVTEEKKIFLSCSIKPSSEKVGALKKWLPLKSRGTENSAYSKSSCYTVLCVTNWLSESLWCDCDNNNNNRFTRKNSHKVTVLN